jgi:hypothetical protein
MKECSATDAIQPTAWKNVSAIAANRDLATVAFRLETQVGRETRLSKALQDITGFDFLFIDPPPTLTLLSISALISVQSVFAMAARNSRQDDPWGKAEDVVDGSEDESAGEAHLFTPVQVDVEGLPGVMAGALFYEITKAD